MTETKTNEDLRQEWQTSVADANMAIDMLQEARDADEPDPEYITECEEQLHSAEERADLAYRTYVQATANWVTEAPRRFDVVLVASTMATADGETVAPALTFAFRANAMGEPITVTYVNSEMEMRRFQKELGKALDEAIRKARQIAHG